MQFTLLSMVALFAGSPPTPPPPQSWEIFCCQHPVLDAPHPPVGGGSPHCVVLPTLCPSPISDPKYQLFQHHFWFSASLRTASPWVGVFCHGGPPVVLWGKCGLRCVQSWSREKKEGDWWAGIGGSVSRTAERGRASVCFI